MEGINKDIRTTIPSLIVKVLKVYIVQSGRPARLLPPTQPLPPDKLYVKWGTYSINFSALPPTQVHVELAKLIVFGRGGGEGGSF